MTEGNSKYAADPTVVFEGIDAFEETNPLEMDFVEADWYMSSISKLGMMKWRGWLDIGYEDGSAMYVTLPQTLTKRAAMKQLIAFAEERMLFDFSPNKNGFDYRDCKGKLEEAMDELFASEDYSDEDF